MIRLELNAVEVDSIQSLARSVAGSYGSTDDPEFTDNATLYAHELPRRVRMYLNDFRVKEPRSALLIVSGYPIDDAKIGDTPAHWKLRAERSPALEEEIVLILMGSLLGDCIGWATQQEGHLVHDILPIKGMEHEQLGSGSEELLWWHTEDAFHPFRGDYLGMLCLRNPDAVPTTFAPLDGMALEPAHQRLLFEPRYTIRPDESHLRKNISDAGRIDDALDGSYQRIEEMNSTPEKIAIFHGDVQAPYARIDPYFMDPVADPEAQSALDALIADIGGRIHNVALAGGDFCFIDNFQSVHGRAPFKARYDGRDRWLKRINIVRDLRKSRAARQSPSSRVIIT